MPAAGSAALWTASDLDICDALPDGFGHAAWDEQELPAWPLTFTLGQGAR